MSAGNPPDASCGLPGDSAEPPNSDRETFHTHSEPPIAVFELGDTCTCGHSWDLHCWPSGGCSNCPCKAFQFLMPVLPQQMTDEQLAEAVAGLVPIEKYRKYSELLLGGKVSRNQIRKAEGLEDLPEVPVRADLATPPAADHTGEEPK